MRSVPADDFASLLAGRRGRATSSPPQFGQRWFRMVSAQAAQNVHSKEQMRASADSGGKSLSQHSQLGRSSSIVARYASIFKAARKALWGISTLPNWRMRFLPSFCFSSSLRLRLMSPP